MADADQQHKQHHHHSDAEKEKKRKKALRRMSKILTKAWELPQAEPFQNSKKNPSSSNILCLTSLGQKVDEEKYGYGRHGWEERLGMCIGERTIRREKRRETSRRRKDSSSSNMCEPIPLD